MTKKNKIIYLAGFFDGEGSIGINKSKNRTREFRYRLELQISQVDKRPLEMFRKLYGGGVYLTLRNRKNPKHQDIYHWVVADKAAKKCLDDLIPYLVVKKEKALLGIEFRNIGQLSRIQNISQINEQTKKKENLRNSKIIKKRRNCYERFKRT